jgi:hypothetical protein
MFHPEDSLLRGHTQNMEFFSLPFKERNTILSPFGSVSTHNPVEMLWISCGNAVDNLWTTCGQLMSKGKRYIDSYATFADFPLVATEGMMAWDDDGKVMYFMAGGAWTPVENTVAMFNTLSYDTNKEVDILNIPELPTWTPVVTLVTPERPAGKYVLGISITYTFLSANRSAYLRWRIDGQGWNEFTSEPKDVQDVNAVFYEYPDDYAQAAHTIEVEMAKEVGGNALDVRFADIMFQRVG